MDAAERDRLLDRLYVAHVDDLGRRTAGVLAAQGWDAVAIHSGSLVKRSVFDDQFWPLRACPSFLHWLPLVAPESVVVVRPGRVPLLLRPAAESFWERPAPPESSAFAGVFEVVSFRTPADARGHVPAGRVAFVGEDPARASEWGIGADAACPPPLVSALEALRTTKTAYEAACIAEANRRARAGHEALRDAFGAGDASELDLHLLFLRETSQDDPETPYKNIVALGENAATLHHVAYGRHAPGRAAESLLVDAGATCRGYASDVTRTWVKGAGAAASAFAHLVAGVEAMQQQLCGGLRVGRPYEELHDESHRLVAAILRATGVVQGSEEEAVATGVTRAFFPHGLGHSLGLQTHDVGCGLRAPRGDNPFLRNTSDIAVGQALTIEPGIYFIDALLGPLRADASAARLVNWGLVDALAPLGGVRIEDDVLVLEQGIRNFTREELPTGGGMVG
jgi:Xaa-Pro dipeptidase